GNLDQAVGAVEFLELLAQARLLAQRGDELLVGLRLPVADERVALRAAVAQLRPERFGGGARRGKLALGLQLGAHRLEVREAIGAFAQIGVALLARQVLAQARDVAQHAELALELGRLVALRLRLLAEVADLLIVGGDRGLILLRARGIELALQRFLAGVGGEQLRALRAPELEL